MSLLSKLKTDDSIANEHDSVGGGFVLNSDVYRSRITLAYLTTAKSEAVGLVLHAKPEGSNQEIRQTLWMTSGKEKGGANYYVDKEGQKQYLAGFLQASALSLLTVGKEVAELDTETKVVKLYSAEAKAEVPTKVEALPELMGQDILIGLIKQVVDKTKKDESTGKYEPTGETREENEIDKFFRASDNKTVAEIRAKSETADFIETWKGKWAGQVKNRAKGAAGAGTAGAPRPGAAPGAAAKKPSSLFATAA